MKVGDYVRTKDGFIGKLKYIDPIEEGYNHYHFEKSLIEKYDKDIKKSSPNIIDLIQEGDILKVNDFKDVYTIYEVVMFRNPYTNEKYLGIRDDIAKRPKRLYEIPLANLSIVTKEQFKSMEYKVGD